MMNSCSNPNPQNINIRIELEQSIANSITPCTYSIKLQPSLPDSQNILPQASINSQDSQTSTTIRLRDTTKNPYPPTVVSLPTAITTTTTTTTIPQPSYTEPIRNRTLSLNDIIPICRIILQRKNEFTRPHSLQPCRVFSGREFIDWAAANRIFGSNTEIQYVVQETNYLLVDPLLHYQFFYKIDQTNTGNHHNPANEKHSRRKLLQYSNEQTFATVDDAFTLFEANNNYILNIPPKQIRDQLFFYADPQDRTIWTLQSLSEALSRTLADFYFRFHKPVSNQQINSRDDLLNYTQIRETRAFEILLEPLLQKMCFVNLGSCDRGDDIIKSFFLNIYNLLAIQIRLRHYPKFLPRDIELEYNNTRDKNKRTTKEDRWSLKEALEDIKYCIGGQLYSLSDIKHGILRGNIEPPSPSTFAKMRSTIFGAKDYFDAYDPRAKYAMKLRDARVLFALYETTPLLIAFESSTLDENLDRLSRLFVDQQVFISNSNVAGSTTQVRVPSVFKRYTGDFGGKNYDILAFIVAHRTLPVVDEQEELKDATARYMPEVFDWGKYKIRHLPRLIYS
jgi:hypothetical protein